MLENLFGNHLGHLQKSLELTTRRHSMLSNNLANVNTPGYKRQDIDFNLMLDDASGFDRFQQLQSRTKGNSAGSLSQRQDGNNVDLEKEVMSLAETELRYQALSDMTSRYFSGLKNVIREGR